MTPEVDVMCTDTDRHRQRQYMISYVHTEVHAEAMVTSYVNSIEICVEAEDDCKEKQLLDVTEHLHTQAHSNCINMDKTCAS